MQIPPQPITVLLNAWSQGDKAAGDQLFAAIHDELRRMARDYLRHERPSHTLVSSALVNEAYLRLVKSDEATWQNRRHFYGAVSHVMWQILVNYAHARNRVKRGGGAIQVDLGEAAEAESQEGQYWEDVVRAAERQRLDLMALHRALRRLGAIDPQQRQVVEARFLWGMTIEETAELLGISETSVNRDWQHAKVWLHRELV